MLFQELEALAKHLNVGRVDDLSFLEYLSPFFLSIEFHCTFSISYKILPCFVYFDSVVIGCRDFLLSCPLYFFP